MPHLTRSLKPDEECVQLNTLAENILFCLSVAITWESVNKLSRWLAADLFVQSVDWVEQFWTFNSQRVSFFCEIWVYSTECKPWWHRSQWRRKRCQREAGQSSANCGQSDRGQLHGTGHPSRWQTGWQPWESVQLSREWRIPSLISFDSRVTSLVMMSTN